MADNINVTPGTGATIAADSVTIDGATALVQRVKPVFGAPGSGADADIGSGTGGSATQRVIVDGSQLASLLTSQGAFAAGSQQVSLPSDHPAIKETLQATTSGGVSRSRTLIPNNTTAIVVKSGAGQVYKVRATNNSGTIAYIKLYDATSATAGSGTPVDTIMIPANSSGGTGIIDSTDVGAVHATGITYIVTTGIADADTTAPAASAYIVTFFYK